MTTITHETGLKAAYLTITSTPSNQLVFKKEGNKYSFQAAGKNINVDEGFITKFVEYASSRNKRILVENQYRISPTVTSEHKGQILRTTPKLKLIGKVATLSIQNQVLSISKATSFTANTHAASVHPREMRHPNGTVIRRQRQNEGKGI